MKHADITVLILAGGQSRRMNGIDKGLIDYHGKPMISHVIDHFATYTRRTLINANRNLETYLKFGFPVLSDEQAEYAGPLAGIASARNHTDTPYLFVIPCDMPIIDISVLDRLRQTMQEQTAPIVVAHDGQRRQNLICLIQTPVLQEIPQYLAHHGSTVARWLDYYGAQSCNFSGQENLFININTQSDLESQRHDANG